MNVNGRDVNFMLTVGASAEISALCPGNDISRIAEAISGNSIEFMAKFIVALSRGYESNREFSEPEYKGIPLTVTEVYTLDMDTFKRLQDCAASAFTKSQETTVEVDSKKKADA